MEQPAAGARQGILSADEQEELERYCHVSDLLALMQSKARLALNSLLTDLNYNTYYGFATKNLIETSLAQIEAGHLDRVQGAWKELNAKDQPT
jgi:hypothetical protein